MEIECKFKTYRYSAGYDCRVTKAVISKPCVDIASYKGNHQPGKSNDDVTEVIFGDVLVEYVPRNLQKIFPNMKTLRIESCGLKQISRQDLIGLENLECLSLEDNQLTSLPDDLFSNMPSLKNVSLGFNKIEFASSKLIEPIVGNRLELFWLAGNTNIGEFYQNGDHNSGCATIQDLMAKIDGKCKPPKPQCGSNRCHAEEIFKGFNEHRLSGRFTDFVIVVGLKEFPVHKNVLATQSPIFDEIFEVKTNGRTASKLEILNLSAEAVEAFLEYLYERKLPDAQNAMEIFKLAAKYEVAKLKIICEGIMQDNLDESNAFEIFKLACGPHKSEELKVAAFEKLKEKFGGELDGDLMNDPEKLQKIVEAKKVLDDLLQESIANKRRLV